MGNRNMTEQTHDFQEYNGMMFHRPKNTNIHFTKNINGHKYFIHRYIWEDKVGPIPDGYEIHHHDENPSNNDINNLVCMTKSDHTGLHNRTRKMSDLTRKKISEAHKGKKPWLGKHHSEETKHKMSLAAKKRWAAI